VAGGLEHQRAPRPDPGARRLDSLRGAGGLDHPRVDRPRVPGNNDNSERAQQVELLAVPSDQLHLDAARAKAQRDERSQAAIADYQRSISRLDSDIHHPQCGGQRLDEHGFFVRDRVRDSMQILHRHGELLGKGAVAPGDPHDLAPLTMPPKSLPAKPATPAGDVDLRHHSGSHPFGAGCFLDHSHELVAGDTAETLVAGEELEVGPTNPSQEYSHQGLSLSESRDRPALETKAPVVPP